MKFDIEVVQCDFDKFWNSFYYNFILITSDPRKGGQRNIWNETKVIPIYDTVSGTELGVKI